MASAGKGKMHVWLRAPQFHSSNISHLEGSKINLVANGKTRKPAKDAGVEARVAG